MPETWLGGMPIQTARWRIAILRLIFRRRWYVQIGPKMYVLRTPVDSQESRGNA